MGYDCVLIPGARKTDLSPLGDAINASMFCGQEKGLATAKGGDAGPKTICSKSFCTCYTYSYQHRNVASVKLNISIIFYQPLQFLHFSKASTVHCNICF